MDLHSLHVKYIVQISTLYTVQYIVLFYMNICLFNAR